MAEGALRWNMGGVAVMVEKLDLLIQESRRPNVRLGIIEQTPQRQFPPCTALRFTIYDSRAVLLGTLAATAIVTDQKDVTDYEEQ